jgi:hypothetical protein
MDLDMGALQRPTPSLPFAQSTGGADVVYVPPLDARRYVVCFRQDCVTGPSSGATIARAREEASHPRRLPA